MPYDNTNSGTLFRNDRKTEDRHADHNGSGQLTCCQCGAVNEFWINAWIKQSTKDAARKFFSFAFKHKQQAAASPATESATAPPAVNEDDGSIPF